MLSKDESLRVYAERMRGLLTDLEREQARWFDRNPGALVSDDLLPRLESARPGEQYGLSELAGGSRRFRRCVIVGAPGSGKSAGLRHLARGHLDRMAHSQGPPTLPLYASLGDWTDPRVGAAEFLRARFRTLAGPDGPLSRRFDELLTAGRLLLLLDGLNELPGRLTGDRRERSLRTLADTAGLRCGFVLACRDQDYIGAAGWQVVRTLPLSAAQIDRFLAARLGPNAERELRGAIDESPPLAEICGNAFYLCALAACYRPGLSVESRGAILSRLVADGIEAVQVVGRQAYRMLATNEVGERAPIRPADERERASVETLERAGLLVRRDGEFFFGHQIIQEFCAASALRAGTVRARPGRLLVSRHWSDTVALWYDLDGERLLPQLMRGLRGGTLPGGIPRLPRSQAPGTLRWLPVHVAVLLVAASSALDWILWPVQVPPSPVGLVPLPPIALAGIGWGLACLGPYATGRWTVILNSARVLTLARAPTAVPALIATFRRMPRTDDSPQLAADLAGFGPPAIPHVVNGLADRHGRVRTGCVFALGELSRRVPGDNRVNQALLAVARAGDPALLGPLTVAIGRSRDPYLIEAVIELMWQSTSGRAWDLWPTVRGLRDWRPDTSTWAPDVLARFEPFLHPDQPVGLRLTAMDLIAALRLPGCEERLAAIAAVDPIEDAEPYVPEGAIMALGLAATPDAVALLTRVAERRDPRIRHAVAQAIKRLRDPAAVIELYTVAASDFAPIRAAVAAAAGAMGGPAARGLLARLANDYAAEVRLAVVRALGALDHQDAVAPLTGLAADGDPEVGRAAAEVLHAVYPDLAVTDQSAADPAHEDGPRLSGLRQRVADALTRIRPVTEAPEEILAEPYRGAAILRAALAYGALAGGVLLVSLVLRLCLWATVAVLPRWPVVLPIVLAVIAVGHVGSLRSAGRRLVKWPAAIAYLALAVVITGGLVYVWWIALLSAAAVVVGAMIVRRAVARRRRPVIVARG